MSLKEKLEKFSKTGNIAQIDWDVKVEEWKTSVVDFYEKIQDWLTDYIKDGYIKTKKSEITLFEENTGNYAISKLELLFADKCAVFEPVGADVIGAEGRIDFYLRGEKGKKYMLILTKDNDNRDQWLVTDWLNEWDEVKFDKSMLEGILDKWLT